MRFTLFEILFYHAAETRGFAALGFILTFLPSAQKSRDRILLRIRNNLFLVSFWKRASFHFACRPSRPGKNYVAPLGALIFTPSWKPCWFVQLETISLYWNKWARRWNRSLYLGI